MTYQPEYTRSPEGHPVDWEKVPVHLWPGLDRWFTRGVVPGGFLTAVLQNDLFQAVAAAGPETLPHLKAICRFIAFNAPSGAWGGPQQYQRWHRQGGMEGKTAAQTKVAGALAKARAI